MREIVQLTKQQHLNAPYNKLTDMTATTICKPVKGQMSLIVSDQ